MLIIDSVLGHRIRLAGRPLKAWGSSPLKSSSGFMQKIAQAKGNENIAGEASSKFEIYQWLPK